MAYHERDSSKQLGLYANPIIMLSTNDYYKPPLSFFDKMVEEKFIASVTRYQEKEL